MKHALVNHRLLHQSGFTLLETVMALVLMTLLMVTIVASTTLYTQYRYRGIAGGRYAQVLLGTLDEMQSDLQACFALHQVQPPTVDSLSEQDPARGVAADSTFAQERVLDFSLPREKPILFVGRSDAILLLRQGANSHFGADEIHPSASQYQILWLAPRTRSIRLPYAMDQRRVAEREYQVPEDLDSHGPALVRCSTPIVEPQASSESPAQYFQKSGASWDKNMEIQQLRFRYFDGVAWQREWNSHSQHDRLPLAIELELTMASAPQQALRFVMNTSRQHGL